MPLIDDLSLPLTDEELRRRKVLGLLGASALSVAGAGTAVTGVQFISPNVLYEPDARLKVGSPQSIAPGAVVAFPKHKVYVVHSSAGFYAMSTVCTHLGCMTHYEAEQGRIFCPCHGSQFSPEGEVVGGPAPRPLPRLKMTLESGVLVVDTRLPAGPGEVLKV
jgi:cytochrome b6-f complex iron-sulfur subunit